MRSPVAPAAFFLAALLFVAPVAVSEPVRVGRIHVDRRNVFDSGRAREKRFPYTLANRIHVVTKEEFIRQELLFKEGDPLDRDLVAESERVLRRRRILRHVRIQVDEPVNGVADVLVQTEDVWTTSLEMSYGLAGGEQTYAAGFLEQNFLGRGRALGGFLRQDIDRFVKGATFVDPHLLASRYEFQSGYGVDEKGHDLRLGLARPFSSTLSRSSEGMALTKSVDEDRRFQGGREVAAFRHESDDVRTFAAWSLGPSRHKTRRLSLAHEYERDAFAPTAGTRAFLLPRRRVVSAALIGFTYEDMRYLKEHAVRTFDRDEDINLGWKWMVEAGPSLEALGATRDGTVTRVQMEKAWNPTERQFVFTMADLDGRIEDGKWSNAIVQARTHYTLVNWYKRNTASARAYGIAGRNIDDGREFLLGAENGLRGYSVRQFSGNKKAIFIFENRNVFVDDWLSLASVGWAVFFDTGAAWKEHQSPSFGDFRSDVGAGLRFALTRSVQRVVIRADVAYALNDNLRRSPWVLSLGGEFRFDDRREAKFER